MFPVPGEVGTGQNPVWRNWAEEEVRSTGQSGGRDHGGHYSSPGNVMPAPPRLVSPTYPVAGRAASGRRGGAAAALPQTGARPRGGGPPASRILHGQQET